jgi:CO/xanthine dehydrogenase FAD-binding subunit
MLARFQIGIRHLGGIRVFTIQDLAQPDTLEEAYGILLNRRSNTVLGGCAFLRLGSKRIGTGVDLSKLNLAYIKEKDGNIEIGAMTTFREIETNPLLHASFNAILPKAVGTIIGVQFRNCVTLGASVYAKYGFSDLLTALLALDTKVELFKGGIIPLEEFLERPVQKDILTRIIIKQEQRKATYQALRNSASDFPILNVAVANLQDQWTIVVGARPLKAKIAHNASQQLGKNNITLEQIENVASLAAEELSFGTNTRGSAEYRRAVCKALVQRAITEVLSC